MLGRLECRVRTSGGHVCSVLWDSWLDASCNTHLFISLVYVDDLHMAATGPPKFANLWLFSCLRRCTDFAYKKFRGGLTVEFVGFYLDYDRVCTGATGLQSFWDDLCRMLIWMKSHLAPLYSWSAALDKSVAATASKLVRLSCMY